MIIAPYRHCAFVSLLEITMLIIDSIIVLLLGMMNIMTGHKMLILAGVVVFVVVGRGQRIFNPNNVAD